MALTLRVVGGLTSDEIARAFLVPTATVQARITRAKKTLAAAQVPFEVPPPEERRERLGSVLSVRLRDLHRGVDGDVRRRPDPPRPRPRGGPAGPGAGPAGARRARGPRPARAARADRGPVPRPHRARRRAGAARGPGPAAVGPRRRSGAGGPRSPGPGGSAAGLGAYGLQAAIAECHAVAPSVEETDWERIVRALRGARPAGALAGRRAQPGGRGLDGPGPGGGAADRRRPGRRRAASPARTCCRACAASCCTRLGRTDEARRGARARRASCAATSASAPCSSASSTRCG